MLQFSRFTRLSLSSFGLTTALYPTSRLFILSESRDAGRRAAVIANTCLGPYAFRFASLRLAHKENIIFLSFYHISSLMTYKHTQIGYLMIVVTIAVLTLFAWTYMTTAAEPPSYDSGNNLLTTATMTLVLFILTSFTTLQVYIDKKQL